MNNLAEEILNYWFVELGERAWFVSNPAVDDVIRTRFVGAYDRATKGELKVWEETPASMLALVMLHTLLPRHMFRGTAKAFATDPAGLDLARTAIIKHYDDRIDASFKLFFYLPFSCSENMGDQRLAIFYIRERTKNPVWLDLAERHHNIVAQFGRFPARNALLNRPSTAAEADYLKANPNSPLA